MIAVTGIAFLAGGYLLMGILANQAVPEARATCTSRRQHATVVLRMHDRGFKLSNVRLPTFGTLYASPC